jgi:hypothetical protein
MWRTSCGLLIVHRTGLISGGTEFFFPPRYDSGKYVHHLPCGVQEAIETTNYAFAVHGGVMRCTSTTMEIYKAPWAPSLARLLLPCIHRGAKAVCSLQCP